MKNSILQVTVEGETYELDVEKSVSLGVLKKKITFPLKVGDVYGEKSGSVGSHILLVKTEYAQDRYTFLGLGGLSPFSNSAFEGGLDKTGLEKWLIDNKYDFVKNINAEVLKLIWN